MTESNLILHESSGQLIMLQINAKKLTIAAMMVARRNLILGSMWALNWIIGNSGAI